MTPFLLDLVRHADALPKGVGGSDHDRALSALGQRQALVLGERMREHAGHPEQVICSTATRTRQTLAPMGYDYTSLAVFEPSIYEAEHDVLLALIAHIRTQSSRALIIGHNPGLQDLLTYLVGPDVPEMITAAYVRLALPARPTRPLRSESRLLDAWAP